MGVPPHPIRFGVFTGVAQTTWPEPWVGESLLPVDESRAVDRLQEYVAVGVTHFIVAARPPYDLPGLERFLTRVAARVRR
jgi:hypothetical protein